MNDDAGGKSALSEGLGLAPERAGQPRMMTISGGKEAGHWYSPAAVRELLAAERERLLTLARARQAHECAAAAHHSVRWYAAFEHHTTRNAAMADLVDAVFGRSDDEALGASAA